MSEEPTEFAKAFRTLRRDRLMSMRAFERVGVPSSYVSAIEKKNLLPGEDKLDSMVGVFKIIAKQQNSKPEDDERLLREAHGRAAFARLGLEPPVAVALAAVKGLADDATEVSGLAPEDVTKPVEDAAEMLRGSGALRAATETINSLNGEELQSFLQELGEAARNILAKHAPKAARAAQLI